jgi:cytochrome P450
MNYVIGLNNRLASRWGKNPHEFDPSRWLDGNTYQGDAVGPYANLCVGHFMPRLLS